MKLCKTCRKRNGTIYVGGAMDGDEQYVCHQCDYDRRYEEERAREDCWEAEREAKAAGL